MEKGYDLRERKNKDKIPETKSELGHDLKPKKKKKVLSEDFNEQKPLQPLKKILLDTIPESEVFQQIYQVMNESTRIMYQRSEFFHENLEFEKRTKSVDVSKCGQLPIQFLILEDIF